MPKTDIRASAQQQTLTWKLHSQALIAPAFTLVIFIGVLPSFFFSCVCHSSRCIICHFCESATPNRHIDANDKYTESISEKRSEAFLRCGRSTRKQARQSDQISLCMLDSNVWLDFISCYMTITSKTVLDAMHDHRFAIGGIRKVI